MRYRPLTSAVLISALALMAWAPAESWAQGREGGSEARKLARHNYEVKQLLERVGEARNLLQAEEYEAALPVTAVLMQRLAPSLVKLDPAAFDLMGHLYTLHALALVGTGSEEGGLWHWNMARSLSDSVAGTPVETYGEAGRRLAELSEGSGNRCSSPAEISGRADTGDEASDGDAAGEDGRESDAESVDTEPMDAEPREAESPVQPPVKVHAPAPTYNQAMRWAGIEGRVILQGAIEESGRVGRVCVLRADAAVLAHLGAQALKGWRFKPATQDGEPTKVYYNITQNFTRH